MRLAIATSASRCAGGRALVDEDRGRVSRRVAADFADAEVGVAGDRGDDGEAVEATPSKLPRSTFHASSASRPVVAASPFMMQPPAKTSAVRASTYVPVIERRPRRDARP